MKALGGILVVLGILFSLSGIGALLGIPMIIAGFIFFFNPALGTVALIIGLLVLGGMKLKTALWVVAIVCIAISALVIWYFRANGDQSEDAQADEIPADDEKKCPLCAETIKKDAVVCKHCHGNLALQSEPTFGLAAPREARKHSPGSAEAERRLVPRQFTGDRRVTNDSYKLYLVKKYRIERNEVLGKFVYNDRLFDTIDHVLGYVADVEEREVAASEAGLRAQGQRDELERERQEALSKEIVVLNALCPNCGERIRTEDVGCAHCKASFSGEGAWRPRALPRQEWREIERGSLPT